MKRVIWVLFLSLFSNTSFAEGRCGVHHELSFFNKLGGELEVELSEKTVPISPNLSNMKATPNATIKRIIMKGEFYEGDELGYRDLIEKELNQIAFNASSITLKGLADEPILHHATNESFFTVRDLLKAIEVTERKTRHKTDWFGGIDVHHVYFQGIDCESGVWSIYWGS